MTSKQALGLTMNELAEANAEHVTTISKLEQNLTDMAVQLANAESKCREIQRDKDSLESVAIAMRDDMREAREKLEAAEKRIDELSASHSKLCDTIAAIHNTIRMDGGYTPLAAILNAAKSAYEESASTAGIGVKGE